MHTLLFYTPGTCALACMVALEWLGEAYDVCLVAREERQGERFRSINPRGQVPALRVDGRVLLEVNAILAHLADRNPDAGLLPPNGTWARDVANQWLSALGTSTHPAFWPFYNPQRYTTDPAGLDGVKAAAVASIRRELGALDAHLADIEHAPELAGRTCDQLFDLAIVAMARGENDRAAGIVRYVRAKARNRWPWRVSRLGRSSPATRWPRCGPSGTSTAPCWWAPPPAASPWHRCRPMPICARWWCMASKTTPWPCPP